MAKVQSFRDKVTKGTHDFTKHCAECGESLTTIKLITSEKSDKSGAWRFNQKFVGMCKCNENKFTE